MTCSAFKEKLCQKYILFMALKNHKPEENISSGFDIKRLVKWAFPI